MSRKDPEAVHIGTRRMADALLYVSSICAVIQVILKDEYLLGSPNVNFRCGHKALIGLSRNISGLLEWTSVLVACRDADLVRIRAYNGSGKIAT